MYEVLNAEQISTSGGRSMPRQEAGHAVLEYSPSLNTLQRVGSGSLAADNATTAFGTRAN
jgi:hypothetical protein